MDDSCAVCAESLEWVAYGACGHREVCSTCVARLRFICEDRRCCICKTESDTVFVTKALGDYTRTISDFSVFPSDAKEGRNESYWFHEATGAYFDDLDQYKMIKAMCKLSCSVCDKAEEQGGNEGHRRRGNFRNIEQLKKHLFFDHHLHMCSLCLEGRKVFICEQKLYTRAQLNQHIKTGDSEVDGSESERGGFMGHPSCEFCRKPFYGDNELYSHMSTEHYTCHICQRQHPGQFEYYKNYDDLEMHFRQLHFLCEDEGCLAKKFIVFSSESEMKRHNAIEHGGNMSRSKRNSALQIPTSFRYRRSSEDDRRGRGGRGRGRGFRSDSSDNQLSMAIEASLETANVDNTIHDHSSNAQAVPQQRENIEIDEIVPPFESLSTTDSEARYLQALGQSSRNAPLQESSFPPLPMAPPSSQQQLKHESEGPAKNTMAARLRRRNKGSVNVLNSVRAWPATNSNSHARPKTNHGLVSSPSHANTSQVRPAVTNGPILSSYANLAQARPATGTGLASASSANTAQARPAATAPMPSSYANLAQARPATGNGLASASSANSWNAISTARVSHSASAPDLVQRGSLDSSMSDFPPVSATLKTKPLTSSVPVVVEDVQIANKSLVEMIRSALEFDEDRYSAFKEISSEFRQGVMGTVEYLSYVQQFGLSHLVLELARLCPDPNKQRELLETYNASVRSENARRSGSSSSNLLKASKSSNKGKGKIVEQTTINSKDLLADSIINTVRQLQANYKSSEDVEVLSKDGYRSSKGKSKAFVSEEQLKPISANRNLADSNGKSEIESAGVGSYQNPGGGGSGGGSGKQKKKTSKFHRVRLGEDSAAALINGRQSESDQEETSDSNQNSSEGGLPVRGVWRNGGGQKLVSLTQKDTVK